MSFICASSYGNQADVIMALAGSNGGSWSTTYTPKSTTRPSPGEKRVPDDVAILRDLQGRQSDKDRPFGSGD